VRIISILIVEDEKLIRTGIRQMIARFFEKHKNLQYVIHESNNGRDAYRKCISECVDILITDIKMPAMSGISLAKRLINDKLPMHILAISGYQDYEYVREMLKLGAYDYLIKPIDELQLHQSLIHFVANLSAPRSAGATTLQLEQRLIEHILLKTPGGKQELDLFMTQNAINTNAGCEVLFIQHDPNTEQKLFELYYIVGEYCMKFADVVTIQGELNVWVVICILKTPHTGFIEGLVSHIEAKGHTICNHFLFTHVSEVCNLHIKLHNAFYNIDAKQQMKTDSAEAELARIRGIILGEYSTDELHDVVTRLFCFYQIEQMPPDRIKRDFSDLIYQIMSLSYDFIEFVSKCKFTRYDITENFENATSLLQLQHNILGSLKYLSEQMFNRREGHADETFIQVKAYMLEHFASDLQLNQVADFVHLHPNYFSTLFRQKIGMTFREYLRKIRIDAAKEYIIDGNYTIGVIAEKVGYGDTAHFFRAFKNVTGMTPKTYKKRNAARQ